MKRLLKALLVAAIIATEFTCGVMAEEINFKDKEDYYSDLCLGSKSLTAEEKSICEEYSIYLSNKTSDMQSQLEEIEQKREEIAKNINEKIKEINKYQSEIETLQRQINELTDQANDLQRQIEETTTKIEQNEAEKEELMNKVKMRMDAAQDTMRLNQYLDYIMGAESFIDLLRRINSTNDLMEYDDMVRRRLIDIINELTAFKIQLERDKKKVEEIKEEVKVKQSDLIKKKKEAEIIKEEWLRQEAEWEAMGNQIAADLDSLKDEIRAMADKIGEIPASTGWTKPVPSYAYKTAGTWHYPGSSLSHVNGGVHLGLDLGYGTGTPVYAVANGVVIVSVDGCETNGYLGNVCGSAQGGTQGGGNQMIVLSRVNGMLYAVKYLHLKKGTPIKKYSKVMAGDKIAEMGGSGNVTGPHLHIEIYKLGDYSINEYIEKWNGNLAFGCGWGAYALNRICSKSGAPCRLRPEEILGY